MPSKKGCNILPWELVKQVFIQINTMIKHNTEKETNPERVVILGAEGVVGSAVNKILIEKNISAVSIGRSDVDLLQSDAERKLKKILKPTDSLLVISAEAPVKNNAMLKRNIIMMETVCNVIEVIAPKHIIYVSSDAVYADSMKPLSESSCAEPGSLHGVMHLARELMISQSYLSPFCIIRPTLIYGADDPHNGYGPNKFRRLAESKEDIVLFGHGEEQRDHVLINDVADLIFRCLLFKSEGVLNAATGTITSFYDVAKLVVSHFSNPVKIQSTTRTGEMPHNGYRAFEPAATFLAFPDFVYTDINTGLKKIHDEVMENN